MPSSKTKVENVSQYFEDNSSEKREPESHRRFGLSLFGSWTDAALRQHGVRHFHETADVGSYDVVDIAVGLGAVFDAHGVDVAHDGMQPGIDLLGRP